VSMIAKRIRGAVLRLPRSWRIVLVLALLVAAIAGAIVVSGEMEAKRRAKVVAAIEQTLAGKAPDAALVRTLEVDRVYLVQWRGNGEAHLSLYIGGLLIDVNTNVKVGGTE